MVIRLIPGGDPFPMDEVASTEKTIHLLGYAGGMLVGGMSYEIDPNLKVGKQGGGERSVECGKIGAEILKCVDLSHEKAYRVRVRKISVDIEFPCEEGKGSDCC